MPKREVGRISYWKVPLSIKVWDRLYGSGPTSAAGIEAALKRNMPTEAQIAAREAAGEEIRSIEEVRKEMQEAAQAGPKAATTVFRRDKTGRPYLHGNYLKGHLRENGANISRLVGFWGLEAFITRTVWVTPHQIYLEAADIKTTVEEPDHTYFTPDVRMSTGVTVKQPTEKITEYIEGTSESASRLKWTLWLLADPRWTWELLEDLIGYGSMRGIGPGRGIDECKYDLELGEKLETATLQEFRKEMAAGYGRAG